MVEYNLENKAQSNNQLNSITRNAYVGQEDSTLNFGRPVEGELTADFLEYQFSLARMDAIDGKLDFTEYNCNLSRMAGLVERMMDRNISPDSIISNFQALNLALKTEEQRAKISESELIQKGLEGSLNK